MSGFKFGFLPEAAVSTQPRTYVPTDSGHSQLLTDCKAEELPLAEEGHPDNLEQIELSCGIGLLKCRLPGQQAAQRFSSHLLSVSDLVPGAYEGGFKLWECAVDLTNYLFERWQVVSRADGSFHSRKAEGLGGFKVLELGCGHGLPGILAVLLGMHVCFQDLNEEVLRHLTMPNLSANIKRLPEAVKHRLEPARFFSGSWATLPAALQRAELLGGYDYIFSSDTIYSLESQPHLLACIAQGLKAGGTAFVAAKSYYFGVGGSAQAFKAAAEASQAFRIEAGPCFMDGTSNVREIILLHKLVIGSKAFVDRLLSFAMSFKLPDLPYGYDALEPSVDAQTMQIHHSKHHATYVNNVNAAVSKFPELQSLGIVDLNKAIGSNSVPSEVATAVRNNGGGHYNHSFFWKVMTNPSSTNGPSSSLSSAIDSSFGSLDELKNKFNTAAAGRFGSGWAWLSVKDGKLAISSTPNQDNPIFDGSGIPILGLDVWEHAYYLKYQNRRPEYISNWWKVVNWDQVAENYETASKGKIVAV